MIIKFLIKLFYNSVTAILDVVSKQRARMVQWVR